MVEEQEREDYREGNPEDELLIDGHMGKGIQDKKTGHGDGHGGSVIDINRAHEIALLPFEL